MSYLSRCAIRETAPSIVLGPHCDEYRTRFYCGSFGGRNFHHDSLGRRSQLILHPLGIGVADTRGLTLIRLGRHKNHECSARLHSGALLYRDFGYSPR